MDSLLEHHRSEILAIAERHGIRDVRVFGYMARSDADQTCDVDLLVSLPPQRTGLSLGTLLMDVQDLLHRRVEVVTEKSLYPADLRPCPARGATAMKPGMQSDRVLLQHIRECVERIHEYTARDDGATFYASRLVRRPAGKGAGHRRGCPEGLACRIWNLTVPALQWRPASRYKNDLAGIVRLVNCYLTEGSSRPYLPIHPENRGSQ